MKAARRKGHKIVAGLKEAVQIARGKNKPARVRTYAMPIHDMMRPDEFYQGLDKGIRFAVRVLHAHGFETCQSCQGGNGHAYFEPTVEMVSGGDDAEGLGALAALQRYGLPVNAVAIVWPVKNGLPYEKLWRITFWRTMEDRADDALSFIFGYRAVPWRPR